MLEKVVITSEKGDMISEMPARWGKGHHLCFGTACALQCGVCLMWAANRKELVELFMLSLPTETTQDIIKSP